MVDKLHSLFDTEDGIHIVHAWTYASTAARDAGTYADPGDQGKVAWVTADDSFWVLTRFSEGPVWTRLSQATAADIYNDELIYGSNSVGVQLTYLYDEKAEALMPINAQTGTTYAPAESDLGKLVTLDNAAAIAVTIPSNAAVPIPVGFSCGYLQKGAGQVTFGITTDTLQGPPGLTKKTRGQWARVTLEKVTSTLWVLSGDVAAS